MSIFKNDLSKVNESEIKLLRRYFTGYDYRGAGYTFIAHYIWKDSFCMTWEVINGYLCLAGTRCGKEDGIAFMPMPLVAQGANADSVRGDSGVDVAAGGSVKEDSTFIRTEYESESLRETLLECKRRFAERGREWILSSIPGHMLDILRSAFPGDGERIEKQELVDDELPSVEDAWGTSEITFIHERDYDEYVYLKEKLIDLSGRALHKKKNHLNFFLRNYEYEAKSIRQVGRDEVLALAAEIRDFKAQSEDEEQEIRDEYQAIEEIVSLIRPEAWDGRGLPPCGENEDEPCPINGVGVYINGKLEAFAIGEVISETLAAEHFEKANDDYRGLYQLVCSEFCKQLPENIVYVNREEDMGLPGLRQAKEALKPDHMEERFTAIINC